MSKVAQAVKLVNGVVADSTIKVGYPFLYPQQRKFRAAETKYTLRYLLGCKNSCHPVTGEPFTYDSIRGRIQKVKSVNRWSFRHLMLAMGFLEPGKTTTTVNPYATLFKQFEVSHLWQEFLTADKCITPGILRGLLKTKPWAAYFYSVTSKGLNLDGIAKQMEDDRDADTVTRTTIHNIVDRGQQETYKISGYKTFRTPFELITTAGQRFWFPDQTYRTLGALVDDVNNWDPRTAFVFGRSWYQKITWYPIHTLTPLGKQQVYQVKLSDSGSLAIVNDLYLGN